MVNAYAVNTPDSKVVPLEPGWKQHLEGEFQRDYMAQLRHFLAQQKREGKTVFPPGPDIFNAFNLTPFDCVKWSSWDRTLTTAPTKPMVCVFPFSMA
jgi:uracil-DNA glycosylase